MPDEASPPERPASLRALMQQVGLGCSDVRRILAESNLLPSTLNTEAELLLQDREAATRAFQDLLPFEQPPDVNVFYARLSEFSVVLGRYERKGELLGVLLSDSYRRWDGFGEQLLRGLNSQGHRAFFVTLNGLETFLAENKLPPPFAAAWFVEILERLGNDMGSGGFWNGLRAFARRFPEGALDVIALLCQGQQQNENSLSVVAALLGVCRGIVTVGETASRFIALDVELENNRRPLVRIYQQRSWMFTNTERDIAPAELEALLHRMSQGTEEEFLNTFRVVGSCLRSKLTPTPTRAIGLNWLRIHATSNLSAQAKHEIINLVADTGSTELDDLISAVQPVAQVHNRTWIRLIDILVQRLESGGEPAFSRLLISLAEAGGHAFIAGLSANDVADQLISALSNYDSSGLLADLLFSTGGVLRSLGFFLLEELPAPAISPELLARKTDTEMMLSLLELRSNVSTIRGQTIADYLLLIAPRMEQAGTELRAKFEEELLVQAKNFPGACLKSFKSAATNGLPLLINAVTKAEGYFKALNATQGSPLTAMHIPGMDRAFRHHARRFSHDVHKRSEEKSVFAQIFKTVHLLYGNQFAFNQGGSLTPQPFQQLSMEMELPRLEFIDPEYMLLRRLIAKVEIVRIEQTLSTQSLSQPDHLNEQP